MVAALSPAQMSDLVSKMKDQGVLYDGLRVLGGGSILGGLILGAIAVFIIDRELMKASGFALAGALLTFFGFMHGEQIGIGQTPKVAVSYLLISGIFAACARFARATVRQVERNPQPHGEGVPAQA